jgi:lysophospholipase L1-like esterase
MKPLVTLNRGFGGAHIAHVNYHFEDVVKKYNPKGIVFFCGTNDIAALKGPKETLIDLNIFINKVKSNLPNVPIFIIGIKPTMAREYLRDEEIQYNQAISDMSEEDNLVTYIDIWEAMLNEDGQPNSNLFVEDNLHINADGYKIWTSIVRKELSNYFDL